jgi:hypothetical protein
VTNVDLDTLILKILDAKASAATGAVLAEDIRWAINDRVGAMATPKLQAINERLTALAEAEKVETAGSRRKGGVSWPLWRVKREVGRG